MRDGWIHTQDLGFVDDGNFVYVVDRKKDMIISGGENIYSWEVEEALRAHPDVAEVAVIAVPDEVWGESVKACVQLRPGSTATEAELIEYTRSGSRATRSHGASISCKPAATVQRQDRQEGFADAIGRTSAVRCPKACRSRSPVEAIFPTWWLAEKVLLPFERCAKEHYRSAGSELLFFRHAEFLSRFGEDRALLIDRLGEFRRPTRVGNLRRA